jgi:hypothetical protein
MLKRSEERRKQDKLMSYPTRLKLCEGSKLSCSTDRGSPRRSE